MVRVTTAGEAVHPAAPPTARSARVRAWMAEQNALSFGVLVVGALSLIVGIGGSLVLLWAEGLTPWTELLQTATSTRQTTLLWTGVVLAVVAVAVGFSLFRRMPTKPAREAAVSGPALGVQTIVLSLVYLYLRAGENFSIYVRQNFHFEKLEGLGSAFLTGARNTVFLALAGETLGIVIGLFLALLVLSRRVVVRAPARAYINFFRGTPLIWQLSFFYFGIVLGARLGLSTYTTGAIVLGLNAGAYSAEIFRAGIQSIERGQIEAARSMGMTYLQAMRYVILPQAFRRVIPPLTNEFIILIKDTSLVYVLGLTANGRELYAVARDAYSELFNSTPYIGAVLGYLAITIPLIRFVTWLERKLRSGLVGVGM